MQTCDPSGVTAELGGAGPDGDGCRPPVVYTPLTYIYICCVCALCACYTIRACSRRLELIQADRDLGILSAREGLHVTLAVVSRSVVSRSIVGVAEVSRSTLGSR